MRKKVNIFSDMWKNGKISYPVKSTMAQLATGMTSGMCITMFMDLMLNYGLHIVSSI